MSRAKQPEPAIKSYFFDQGYRDLGATIKESWKRNRDSAGEHFGKVGKHMPGEVGDKALAILWAAAGVSVMVFGTAVFLAASAVHIAVLAAFLLVIYLAFSLVYLTERAYLTWKGFFSVCPVCSSKNPLAEYFCPGCGAVHRGLIPSSYGILHHTCKCGQRLPATFFLKRGQIRSRCPDCESLLETGHTESRKTFVPIFGGPGVGKSAFLFSAANRLISYLETGGLHATFLESLTEDEMRRVREQLEMGMAPAKTLNRVPRAFNVQVAAAGQDPRVLYLYDPAGDLLFGTQELAEHKYQKHMNGLIFMIDPFTIPAVREEYSDRLQEVRDALKPSGLPVEDALSRILIGLEEHFGLSKGDRIKVPVAVVINKIDAFDLEQKLGGAPAAAAPPSFEATRDEVLREQLRRWDAGVVHELETRCARLRFFACSALGRMPDDSAAPFEARGVLEPMLWILSQADPLFASERKKAA